MLAGKKLVWLFLAFHYSNASTFNLKLCPFPEPALHWVVTVPERIDDASENSSGGTTLRLTEDDAISLQNSDNVDSYSYHSLSFPAIMAYLDGRPRAAVIIRWFRPSLEPVMEILPHPPGRLNLRTALSMPSTLKKRQYIRYHLLLNGGGGVNDYSIKAEVLLYFGNAHSQFPEAAYEQFKKSIPEGLVDSFTDEIDCDVMSRLKLPTLKFSTDSGQEVFTLSKSNYFLQSPHDGKCFLAVKRSANSKWVIGAALIKTYEIMLMKDDERGHQLFYFNHLISPSNHEINE
ncbi:unnamed protein product [Albugo candida]|uniref:Peptidase A1 domain-containing protein n=1 Tax=Albugo candida TaxID=65357 RepID=A0A024FUF8_9STRA|nr:unnamed protein product [Albugo candida]|eukprot:CCI10671.1 unnamed protein product [Albugo candida]